MIQREKLSDSYPNGECPDCGELIPDDMVDGGDCKNCGHVLYHEHAATD